MQRSFWGLISLRLGISHAELLLQRKSLAPNPRRVFGSEQAAEGYVEPPGERLRGAV